MNLRHTSFAPAALLLSVLVLSPCLAQVPTAPADGWCGSGNAELPLLWEQMWVEADALDAMPAVAAWTNAPARVSRLLRNASLLHRSSVNQGVGIMAQVQSTQQKLTTMRASLIEAAQRQDRNAFTQQVSRIRTQLAELGTFYPATALKVRMAPPAETLPTLKLEVKTPPLVVNQPAEITLRLTDAQGRGVSSLQLIETHTRKLHAFLIDSTFEDYQHEHPITSGAPGTFSFAFTPRRAGDYTLWLDAMPQASARTEYPSTLIPGGSPPSEKANEEPRLQCVVDHFRFVLNLGEPVVRAGQIVNARMKVSDGSGRPCFNLEPFMGDFAHVVGIADDRKTLLHVHSHIQPPGEHERSGPDVPFHFMAPRQGFLRIFVQTQIQGVIRTARFGVAVE